MGNRRLSSCPRLEADRPDLEFSGVLNLARRDEKVAKIATEIGAWRGGLWAVADRLEVRKDRVCRLGEWW